MAYVIAIVSPKETPLRIRVPNTDGLEAQGDRILQLVLAAYLMHNIFQPKVVEGSCLH
jgi:hypothetical protein